MDTINTDLEGIFTVKEIQLFMLLYAENVVAFSKSSNTLHSMSNNIETYCGI